jgi:hypothetical protein
MNVTVEFGPASLWETGDRLMAIFSIIGKMPKVYIDIVSASSCLFKVIVENGR